MENTEPTVSIVVRTKDRPVLLLRALASLAAQSHRPLEAVVVNDGGVALDEANLRGTLGDVVLRLETLAATTGRAHAANVGLAAASGAFIGFLDDDDELLPGHVALLLTQAALTGSRVVYSDCEIVQRDLGAGGEVLRESSRGRFAMSRGFSPDVLLFENYIPLICVLFAREALAGARFDEGLELFEDWDFYLQVCAHHAFLHVPEITCRYVQWSRASQIAFSDSADGRAAYLRVLGKNAARISPDAIYHYYLARQGDARAAESLRRTLERELDRLRVRCAELEFANAGLAARLARDREFIDAVTGSLSWRLLQPYRTLVGTTLAPPGSRRRRVYDALLHHAGRRPPAAADRPITPPTVALTPPTAQRPPALPPAGLTRERFEAPARVPAAFVSLPQPVSVIVPTLDGGAGLRELLLRLRGQRGLGELEIVAVDAGSCDGTLATCRELGIRTVALSAGQRDADTARAEGVARARGEYLVLASQDAFPIGEEAVARMVRFLAAHPDVAAVSAREVPASDADLLTCWRLSLLDREAPTAFADTVVGLDPGGLAALTPRQRRRLATVGGALCCLPRRVVDELGLRPLPGAGLLDLGLRALTAGLRLGRLPAVGVVRSPRLDAPARLRRAFAERLAEVDLLGFEPRAWPADGLTSVAAMLAALRELCGRLDAALAAGAAGGAPAALEESLRRRLREPAGAELEATPLQRALAALPAAGADAPAAEPAHVGLILDGFLALLHELLAFASAPAYPDGRAGDPRGSLAGLLAEHAGTYLADVVRTARTGPADAAAAAALTHALAGGA